ncbi:MAG: hypothetical protein ACREQJ_13400 [Candidatus Binatia bacterium]
MAIGFDPLSPAFRADPWATYAELRREDPVHRSALGMWVLTRYDDVAATLRDPRFGTAGFGIRQETMLGPGAASRMSSTWMLFKDPPDHGRLRGLVSRALTPAAIEWRDSFLNHALESLPVRLAR